MQFFRKKEKKYQDSITYFTESNWQIPSELTLELYEISVCYSTRNTSTYRIIEFFIPEYNMSFNKEKYDGGYNIIQNASHRITNLEPKHIKTIKINNVDPKLKIIYEMLSSYIKLQHTYPEINELFN